MDRALFAIPRKIIHVLCLDIVRKSFLLLSTSSKRTAADHSSSLHIRYFIILFLNLCSLQQRRIQLDPDKESWPILFKSRDVQPAFAGIPAVPSSSFRMIQLIQHMQIITSSAGMLAIFPVYIEFLSFRYQYSRSRNLRLSFP